MGTAVSVGIANKAIIFLKNTFGYSCLLGSLFLTATNRNYFSHIAFSLALSLSPGDKNHNINLVSVFHGRSQEIRIDGLGVNKNLTVGT